jgi:hypothetical protein
MYVKDLDFKYYADLLADCIRNDVLNHISDETVQSEILSFIDAAVTTTCDTYNAELKAGKLSRLE